MGTRADFYIGRGAGAEWIGSIAYDGDPDGNPADVLSATTEAEFRGKVGAMLEDLSHGTKPEQGWPWPWEDSNTTDYAYAFDGGTIWINGYHHGWKTLAELEIEDDRQQEDVEFPNMKARQNVTLGSRSGLLILTGEVPDSDEVG